MLSEPAYVPPMSPELMTAEQLLEVSIPGNQVELVRGRLVVKEPPGYRHGDITARLAFELMEYVRAQDLGQVLVGDPGFTLARNPDTVRGSRHRVRPTCPYARSVARSICRIR